MGPDEMDVLNMWRQRNISSYQNLLATVDDDEWNRSAILIVRGKGGVCAPATDHGAGCRRPTTAPDVFFVPGQFGEPQV